MDLWSIMTTDTGLQEVLDWWKDNTEDTIDEIEIPYYLVVA